MRQLQSVPKPSGDADRSSGDRELSLQQLAHEMSSLLDGALRCLALARRSLGGAPGAAETHHDALENLRLTSEALQRMAVVLERTMCSPSPGVELLDDDRCLGASVPAILALFEPMARAGEVDLCWTLRPEAAGYRSGLLETIIVNGLRNALQAAIAMPRGCRRVDLCIGGGDRTSLEVCITDSGPGLGLDAEGREGHGLGLDLCRQIVRRLDGSLELINVPYGTGAVLRVRVPFARLASDGQADG